MMLSPNASATKPPSDSWVTSKTSSFMARRLPPSRRRYKPASRCRRRLGSGQLWRAAERAPRNAPRLFRPPSRLTGRRFSPLSLSLDLVELGQRAFKFVIEEPHRIENLAEGCRCFRPVSMSKGEDAVFAQVSHDGRVMNRIAGQAA